VNNQVGQHEDTQVDTKAAEPNGANNELDQVDANDGETDSTVPGAAKGATNQAKDDGNLNQTGENETP
jgi:hypothetical protein